MSERLRVLFRNEYQCWKQMRRRCLSPKTPCYLRYGGRGIRICERWAAFGLFLEDMGPRPSLDHSLERIDNNGHYEPGNVCWATRAEQNRNRSNTRFLVARGRTLCINEWAREVGIPDDTIRYRLKLGWSVEEALFVPVGARRPSAPPNLHRAKLDRRQVEEIRRHLADGVNPKSLAQQYQVSRGAIGFIASRKTWA